MRWVEETVSEETADRLAQHLSISAILSRFLVSRGLTEAEATRSFLRPKLAELADPFDLPSLREAVERLAQSLKKKESVLIVGDYDVDGITSTVILHRILTTLGTDPTHITPNRIAEGPAPPRHRRL